ncbi:MAG: cupin domain-containing protein [Coriobacteriales bacterium]|jgi:transcriptional regulator with XRE-family HTH domain|nr:cupin domain-containing protein [Coriobacteriales bacterium]
MQATHPDIFEVSRRIRSLREDLGLTVNDMAKATGRSAAEYEAQESGKSDLSFTFLYKCATKLGVDVIELLTGEAPHLTAYEVTRATEGLSISRRAGFQYLHQAAMFKHKLCEPFIVTAPYLPEQQDKPIHLSQHDGQELDYIISGNMRFAYENHIEELGPGDTLYYDSGRGHGMIAIGGAPCVFLAIVLKPQPDIGFAQDAQLSLEPRTETQQVLDLRPEVLPLLGFESKSRDGDA